MDGRMVVWMGSSWLCNASHLRSYRIISERASKEK